MSAGSEIADLLVFLAIICVPLAVGGVCIPVGRAIADRIRDAGRPTGRDEVVLRTLWEIEGRLASLERMSSEQSKASALLAESEPQMNRAVRSRTAITPSGVPRSITPH